MKSKLSRTKRKVLATVTFAGDGTIKKISQQSLSYLGSVKEIVKVWLVLCKKVRAGIGYHL